MKAFPRGDRNNIIRVNNDGSMMVNIMARRYDRESGKPGAWVGDQYVSITLDPDDALAVALALVTSAEKALAERNRVDAEKADSGREVLS